MRTSTSSSIIVRYPDEVTFAYNPNYIEITGANSASYATITVSNGTKSMTITPSLVSGKLKSYISRLLQIMCENKSESISVSVYVGGANFYLYFTCINGSIDIGQRLDQIGSFVYDPEEMCFVRRVRWFKNFPFTASVFCQGTKNMRVRYDDNGYSGSVLSLNNGFNEITPKNILSGAKYKGVLKISNGNGIKASTFDDTYDYSFKNLLQSTQIIRLNVDESKEGHYFKWTDNMCQTQYFLFKYGIETNKVDDEGAVENDFISNGIYFSGIDKVVSKKRSRELSCVAVNLTMDEREYVQSIAYSTDCQMYIGEGLWIPVNIKKGSIAFREKDALTDIEIVVEIPTSHTRTL